MSCLSIVKSSLRLAPFPDSIDAKGSVIVRCDSSGTTGVTRDPPCVYFGSSERRRGDFPAIDLIGRLVDAASGSGIG